MGGASAAMSGRGYWA